MTPLVFEHVTGRERRLTTPVRLAPSRHATGAGGDVIVRVTDPSSVWHGHIGTVAADLGDPAEVEFLAAGVRVALHLHQLTTYHPTDRRTP